MSFPLLLVFASFLAFWLARTIWRYFLELQKRNELGNRIFGPPAHPLLGNLHMFPKCSFDWTEFVINQSNQAIDQGQRVIRWWAAWKLAIWTLDAETSRVLLEHSTELKKGRDYEFYQQWLGLGLLLSDGPKWRHQRKYLTPTFHFSMLDHYAEVFNGQAQVLVQRLAPLQGQPQQDVAPLLTRCTLDILGEAAMGIQLESEQDQGAAYVRAVAQFNRLAHLFHTNMLYWVPGFWHLFGRGLETDRHVHTLKQFTQKVIVQRTTKDRMEPDENEKSAPVTEEDGAGPKRRRAFMDLLLEMEAQGQLTREEVREQTDTFMFAGHDTTATALGWTMWCLACHPECQRRVRQEVWEQFPLRLDEEEPPLVTAAAANELRYLDRCLREALRLFPPVPILERDLQEDLLIGGCLIPKGTMVIVSPLILHHNEKVYPSHWTFDPDNFLPESQATRSSFDFIPFSAGPRNCIGQRFALLELKIVLAHLLRRFRFTTDIRFLENRPALEAILRPEMGVPVRVESAAAEDEDEQITSSKQALEVGGQ